MDRRASKFKTWMIFNDNSFLMHKYLRDAVALFEVTLPLMPLPHLRQLVFDAHHQTIALIYKEKLVGGACFRPFPELGFTELSFFSISPQFQLHGLGSMLITTLMGHLKHLGIDVIVCYGDNMALPFFFKLGFRKRVYPACHDHIQHYTSSVLIQCKLSKLSMPSAQVHPLPRSGLSSEKPVAPARASRKSSRKSVPLESPVGSLKPILLMEGPDHSAASTTQLCAQIFDACRQLIVQAGLDVRRMMFSSPFSLENAPFRMTAFFTEMTDYLHFIEHRSKTFHSLQEHYKKLVHTCSQSVNVGASHTESKKKNILALETVPRLYQQHDIFEKFRYLFQTFRLNPHHLRSISGSNDARLYYLPCLYSAPSSSATTSSTTDSSSISDCSSSSPLMRMHTTSHLIFTQGEQDHFTLPEMESRMNSLLSLLQTILPWSLKFVIWIVPLSDHLFQLGVFLTWDEFYILVDNDCQFCKISNLSRYQS